MEQAALRTWLLDRMEAPSLWTAGDARLLSTNQLTDLLRRDADFLSVAALYAGRADVNLEALVTELVAKDPCRSSLPFAAPKPDCASGRNGKPPGTNSAAKTRSTPKWRGAMRSVPRPSGMRRNNGRPQIHGVWRRPRALRDPHAGRRRAGRGAADRPAGRGGAAPPKARRGRRHSRAAEIRHQGFSERRISGVCAAAWMCRRSVSCRSRTVSATPTAVSSSPGPATTISSAPWRSRPITGAQGQ